MKFFDTTITNLVANLPLPRLLLIVGLFVCLLFAGVCLFESHTAILGLMREDKSIQLIKDLLELEQNEILNSEHLMKIYSKAAERTDDLLFTESKTIPRWKKGLAGSWLWLLLVLITLPGTFNKKHDLCIVLTFLGVAIVVFCISMESSAFWWPWFHAVILVMIQGILAFMGFRFVIKKSDRSKT